MEPQSGDINLYNLYNVFNNQKNWSNPQTRMHIT